MLPPLVIRLWWLQTDTEDAPIEEPKKVVKLKTATPSAEPDDLGSIVNEWFDD